ncbi:MAG: DUF4291 domain-containing protein [Candidatus Lokiarchaeota archaeon]|nr:DUF4291 domain-containing protein [Candidatus Lokiarchaeota archaeon]
MELIYEKYSIQKINWPSKGRYILAQYNNKSIIVYQAYNHYIANFALNNGYFGGSFKFTRMSWIKPNFLWMMYRSGWATKKGQNRILAISIKRSFFERILEEAVPSTYIEVLYPNKELWKEALNKSHIRLQWDPDHDPIGNPLERRAIQIGIRGNLLKEYASNAILKIIDLTDFVNTQRKLALNQEYNSLITPKEEVFIPKNSKIIEKIGLDLK